MLVDSYNPETGDPVVAPALPFRFSAGIHDGGFSSRPPAKGEQTADILEALSYSAADIDRLHEQEVVFSEA